MTSLSQFPLLIHPTRKVQNSRLDGTRISPTPVTTKIKISSPYLQPYTGTLCKEAVSPRVTVESRRELRTGSALDGKLPAGNHRQFRCYCPLEPLRKVCILAVLTEGQRTRVTVSGNRFLAEFRRATEYRMTLRIETPRSAPRK